MSTEPSDNPPFYFPLIVWDTQSLDASIVGDFDANTILAAMFDDGDHNEILLVNENGVVHHTVSTEQTVIVNTQITSTWAYKAAFSNGGQWLAVAREENGGSVYVFDLSDDFVGLKVQYYPESTTRTQFSEMIEGQFNIVNTSSTTVDLNDLKIRYFFSRDSNQPLEAYCTWAAFINECDDVTATSGLLSTPVRGNDAYLEIGFTAGILGANSETEDIIVRVNKQDWSDFDQRNDFSFDQNSSSDTFIDWTNIALYYNGKLVWGTEPW